MADTTKKILIIEDNEGTRYVLEKFLGHFFEVTAKQDGKEALIWISKNLPDLIITDLDMPNLNGIQFIKNIKTSLILRNIKIMVITGHDDEKNRSICTDHGIVEYYVKPFNPAELVLRIYEIFNLPAKGNKKIEKLIDIN